MPSWKPFLGSERCFALRFVWSADSRSLHEQQFNFPGSLVCLHRAAQGAPCKPRGKVFLVLAVGRWCLKVLPDRWVCKQSFTSGWPGQQKGHRCCLWGEGGVAQACWSWNTTSSPCFKACSCDPTEPAEVTRDKAKQLSSAGDSWKERGTPRQDISEGFCPCSVVIHTVSQASIITQTKQNPHGIEELPDFNTFFFSGFQLSFYHSFPWGFSTGDLLLSVGNYLEGLGNERW